MIGGCDAKTVSDFPEERSSEDGGCIFFSELVESASTFTRLYDPEVQHGQTSPQEFLCLLSSLFNVHVLDVIIFIFHHSLHRGLKPRLWGGAMTDLPRRSTKCSSLVYYFILITTLNPSGMFLLSKCQNLLLCF